MASTATEATSPADKVFNTAELAEMIFLHLSLVDLARFMRLCHTSCNVIQSSKLISSNISKKAYITRWQDAWCVGGLKGFKWDLDFDNSIASPSKLNFAFTKHAFPSSTKRHRLQWWFKEQRGAPAMTGSRCKPKRPTIRPRGPGRDSTELWRRVRILDGTSRKNELIFCNGDGQGARIVMARGATLGEMYDLLCQAAGYYQPAAGENTWSLFKPWDELKAELGDEEVAARTRARERKEHIYGDLEDTDLSSDEEGGTQT